ncbi:unnamed protein product [Paramecium octaurelia]|uniref:Uncharacterized protein n=1 Tax=Paramecium octaurelia TaxID=43137 RepID=A0A8S1W941_PAROT|nr:unnamed protein product [Paramecium octaurelia]
MYTYPASQQFSPYSVTKQNQAGQVQRSTPFDEDNETSNSGSQIFNQVQVTPQNRVNLDELFDDNQVKSNQDFPFWEQDSQQGKPQINTKNAENSLFNFEQNLNNQIFGISPFNQTQKPQDEGQLQQQYQSQKTQGVGQPQQQNINKQNQILDEFDEMFEKSSQDASQNGLKIDQIQQNNQEPFPLNFAQQQQQQQQQQIQPKVQNADLDGFSFPFFQDPLPPFQINQNTNQFQGFQTKNLQIREENQSKFDEMFNQPSVPNLQFQIDNKLHTPANQSQIQSQKSLNEKHIPNSNNSSSIKQYPLQTLQFPIQNNLTQQEVKNQPPQLNFSLDLDQDNKQQKSVSNSQRDDSDLPWDDVQKSQAQQKAIDFFQGPNFFEINKELNQQPKEQVQNKEVFNLWQIDNNDQFNNNLFQQEIFNDELNLQQNQDIFNKEHQPIPTSNSFDQFNLNEHDIKTQFQAQNQQGSNQFDFLQWKQQNTVQSESDDVLGQFQQKLDVPQKEDDSDQKIQNQQTNQFEYPFWNEKQAKAQSESQSSVKDADEKFEFGWNNIQQGNFQQDNQFSNWDGYEINQEQKMDYFHKDDFDQHRKPQHDQEGSQLEQSVHNSESPTQQITLYGNQGQEKENKLRFVQDEGFYDQKDNQKINFDSFDQKENFIDESKVIQQSQNKTQSFEFPSSVQMGFYSVRESKEDNKEQTYADQIMELLLPKIAEITQTLSNDFMNTAGNFQQEGQNVLYEGIYNILQNEKRRIGQKKEKYLNQQVQIIEDIIVQYDNKTHQLQEQIVKVKEEQQKERQKSTGNMSFDSIEIKKSKQINEQIEESPIQNIQLQVSPNPYTPQNSQEKPHIPFQLIHQTQSKFLNESIVSQDNKEEDLIKFQTNQVFQRQCLKGLQLNEIQKFRKQCLSDQVVLLETQELIITQSSEKKDSTNQEYKMTLIYKNKGSKGIQNLIVCFEGKKLKNDYQAYPQKIAHQFLKPGESIKQEIRFRCYDQLEVYLNCYLIYTVMDNRFYWSQGQQGSQNNELLYRSQVSYQGYNNSQYNQYSQGQGNTQYDRDSKRTYQFIIGKPVNRFFAYNYWTVEELNEYKMRYQGEEFPLKSLEELIIYHPWLVQLDQQTLCGKVLIRLEENDYDFVVKVVLKDQKGIIKMNQTDMDQKLCEHLLSFLSFLFFKLY